MYNKDPKFKSFDFKSKLRIYKKIQMLTAMKKMARVAFFLILPVCCFSENHFSGETQIHGFLSQGYLKSTKNNYYYADTKDGTFEFNEAALNVTTRPTTNLRLGIQILARDTGDFGNDRVEIDWMTGDYRYRKWLGFRAGKMKMSFGLYNQSRDIEAARTFIILPSSLYNENERETLLSIKGAGVYGVLPGGVRYQAQHGVIDIRPDGPTVQRMNEGRFGQIFGKFVETDIDPATSVQMMWDSPVEGLQIGGTFFDFGFLSTTMTDTVYISGHRYVISTEYRWDPLTLTAEYLFGEDHVSSPSRGITFPVIDVEGWYGAACWQFNGFFEIGTYYSQWFPNTDNDSYDNYSKDLALATRFDLNRNTIIKFECHYIEGTKSVDGSEPDSDKYGVLMATRVTFYF